MYRVEEVVAEDVGQVVGESKPTVERWEEEKQSRVGPGPFVTSAFDWIKAHRWKTMVKSGFST